MIRFVGHLLYNILTKNIVYQKQNKNSSKKSKNTISILEEIIFKMRLFWIVLFSDFNSLWWHRNKFVEETCAIFQTLYIHKRYLYVSIYNINFFARVSS